MLHLRAGPGLSYVTALVIQHATREQFKNKVYLCIVGQPLNVITEFEMNINFNLYIQRGHSKQKKSYLI